MRRKLTTPDTWNVIAAIVAIGIIVLGATWLWDNGRSSSQEAFAVKQADGKILVTSSEWATVQAHNVTFAHIAPGHDLTLDALVDQRLEYAEAAKRGTVCTTEEAATMFKAGDDSLLNSGDPSVLKFAMYNVENAGVVPAGYSLTPEAERTPSLVVALKALESDPKSLESYRKTCSIGRLYASLAPDGDNRKRNDAISALRSKLRVDAGLEYDTAATATPLVTGTPTATMTVSVAQTRTP